MPRVPSARLPRVSRALLIAPFLVAASLAPVLPSAAHAESPITGLSRIRAQRVIADDFEMDQMLSVRPSVVASADASASASPAEVVAEEPIMLEAAGVSQAMKPLALEFHPMWPSAGSITTYFGEVASTSPRGHAGVDIGGPYGTPILAADDGEVLKAFWSDNGYGGLVIVAHPSGYETWYAHLQRLDVSKGDRVTRGEQLGQMGSTGYSTGPHLHFEVRQDGELRNPMKWLDEGAINPVGKK
jgi:murein DD-endopeptidase MepM/ murein hydrolase activator NlpD